MPLIIILAPQFWHLGAECDQCGLEEELLVKF
jgi:hypothetical protein